jgi:hypothetical protein
MKKKNRRRCTIDAKVTQSYCRKKLMTNAPIGKTNKHPENQVKQNVKGE